MLLPNILVLAIVAILTDNVLSNIIQSEPRIIFGKNAKLGQLPYQVSLQFQKNNVAFCGGSIIDLKHVVTAAHCVIALKKNDKIQVWSGNLTLQNGGNYRDVKNIFIHEKYDTTTMDYDIAVLRLKSPFIFNNITRPIELPSGNILDQTNCTVSGWGDTEPKINIEARKLLYAHVQTINWEKCFNVYNQLTTKITRNMFCAGDLQGQDACQGDSGGPLACKNTARNSTYLAGIVSFGIGCGDPAYPGVYTNVYPFVNWIKKQQKRNSANFSSFNIFLISCAGIIHMIMFK